MAKKSINARCPLAEECERRACEFVRHELDCIYYSTNGWGDNGIPDQEELRAQRDREEWRKADEEAMDKLALEEDERTIEVITGEILTLKQTAGEAILEIGRKLIEAKELLPHGEWLPWLNERVEFSERVAQKFMKLAKEWANPNALTDLGKQKALALLAIPVGERESFMAEPHTVDGQEKMVVDMTTRQLEQAIRDRDEARKQAEQAKAQASTAEAARAKMAADMAHANALLGAAHEEHHSHAAEIARLEKELHELRSAPVEVAVMEVDQEALDKARAEGAAEIQAKLDKAKAAHKKAEDKRKAVEEALADANRKLDELAKAEEKASIQYDEELAQYKVRFSQVQDIVNQMHGQLLKARARNNQSVARGMQKSMLALAEQIRRCAE